MYIHICAHTAVHMYIHIRKYVYNGIFEIMIFILKFAR